MYRSTAFTSIEGNRLCIEAMRGSRVLWCEKKCLKTGMRSEVRNGYLALCFNTLALSELMATAFHTAVLAISSDMLTTEGSMLQRRHIRALTAGRHTSSHSYLVRFTSTVLDGHLINKAWNKTTKRQTLPTQTLHVISEVSI